MSSLVQHIERHLGPILGGWATDADGTKLPFQVVHAGGGPLEGAQCVLTLGLSHHPLAAGDRAGTLRQELMFMFRAADGPRNLPGVLQQIGLQALTADRAYSLGQILGPRGELMEGSPLQALYVAQPVYLPDDFHVFNPDSGVPIVFGWLVPISASEATFARTFGTDRFEEALEASDPDLLDFARAAIV